MLTPQILARKVIQKVKTKVDDAPAVNPCDWIEQHFRIPETPDKRFTIAPYQRVVIEESQRKDKEGKFVYSTILYSDIKKSLKSCIAAAMALHVAMSREWATVYIIANDLKQADSRVAYYIRRAVELNDDLKKVVRIKNHLLVFPNHSTIEAIPIDPQGESGSNADFLVYSELWGWKNLAARTMWTEMTLSPTKFGFSQRWIETYAGHSGESPILEGLYDTAVVHGAPVHSVIVPDLELTRAGSTLALWNTRPRLSWQTEPYYRSEEEILLPHEFRRVHRNEWGTSSNPFIHGQWWDNCSDAFPDFPKWLPWVFALDAGVSNDCFAIVGVVRFREIVYARYCQVYLPPDRGKIDFSEVEKEVMRLKTTLNVECFTYDPFQLEDMAQRLTTAGAYMRPFNQTSERLIADRRLYDLIRERRVRHQNDAVLTAHVKNANAVVEGGVEENKLRIVKRSDLLKIDACVALSMAADVAIRYELNAV